MSTSRISLLPIADSKHAAAPVGIMDLKAELSIYRVLLHQPQLAQRINDLMDTLTNNSSLHGRLREMIIMRIGWINNGVYEWTQHWQLAPLFGVDHDVLLATREWERHDHWSATDRVVLQATDDVVRNGVISDETWVEYTRVLPSDRERLDLVATIGAWKMMSELVQSLDVPLDDGLTPWPPDGVAPHREVVAQ